MMRTIDRQALPPIQSLRLNDGNYIPQLGFGLAIAPEAAIATVLHGLETGYRLIDTAAAYRTESGVRDALARGAVRRDEVFITTKLSNHGRDVALRSFERSLKRLGTDYVDLYLIHFPFPAQNRYVETWEALTELRAAGRARSIGVSNFDIPQLERIINSTGVIPAINQVQLHTRFQQPELRHFHQRVGIVTEAYSPLGRGTALRDPTIEDIAARYQRTPAQIVLRWHVQLGNVVVPRSVTPARLEENVRIFDFDLSETDMRALADRDMGERLGPDPSADGGATGIRRAILEVAERYPAIDPLIQTARRTLSLARRAVGAR
jgi:2,5-diketo-D-gluconate reductase A